jgi:hypothetical protein
MSHWSYRTIEATNTTPEIDKKVNDMAGHFQPLGVAALIQPITGRRTVRKTTPRADKWRMS